MADDKAPTPVIEVSGSPNPTKKLKQARLPFAPIKVAPNDGTGSKLSPASPATKRKRSEHSDCEKTTPNKMSRDDLQPDVEEVKATDDKTTTSPKPEPMKSPRRITPIFVGAAKTQGKPDNEASKKKKRVSLIPVPKTETENGVQKQKPEEIKDLVNTPSKGQPKAHKSPKAKASPAVLEDRRRKLEVVIAKLSVEIHELNDEMQKAVDAQDFIAAQEFKTKISSKTDTKSRYQDIIKNSPNDISAIESALKELKVPDNEMKTPTSSRKRSAVKVTTPGAKSSESDDPASETKMKKLTPKQEARKMELQKRREEKEKEKEMQKLQKEKEKEEARVAKEKLKEEARMRKEQEKEAKELEKRQKEEAKQAEQERKRQEKEKKLEEKERKQEEKERKQEEKDRKIEEKRKKEEAEKAKTEKIAKSFTSFFIKKETTQTPSMDESCEDEENTSCFTRFRIKKDMRLAPVLRRGDDFDPSTLDDKINCDAKSDHLYLAAIKRRDYKPGHQGKTWPVEEIKKDSDNEVEVLEEDEDDEDLPEGTAMAVDLPDMESASAPRAKYRVKLLQFCENQRPAYFGTWMKQSKFVGPRKPFGRDSEFFDYDYDSDDDWEEEEQGESLSDEEKDKEEDERDNDDEEDEDDGFFVGHGVLDKEELMMLNKDSDDEDEVDTSKGPSSTGFFDEELEEKKQKLRAQKFEEEYKKKKPTKLKPRVIGPVWVDENRNDVIYEQLMKVLTPFKAVLLARSGSDKQPTSIPTEHSSPKPSPSSVGTPSFKDCNAGETPTVQGSSGKAAKRSFPEEAMPDLIRLVHCNQNNKMFLSKEFSHYLIRNYPAQETLVTKKPEQVPTTPTTETPRDAVPKTKILERITDIADYKKPEETAISSVVKGKCWLVKPEALEKYDMVDKVKAPNNWEYILAQPNKESTKAGDNTTPKRASTSGVPSSSSEKKMKSKADATEQDEKKKTTSGQKKSIQELFRSMTKRQTAESEGDMKENSLKSKENEIEAKK